MRDSGPFGPGPLPLRALCPLPPLPNRLKLKLAAAGARGSGLRVAPGWERGAPPLGQKGTLRLRLAHFWRSPWTLPNGTPVFELSDLLQALMVVSYGPTGLSGVCRRDPREKVKRDRNPTVGGEALPYPVLSWDRSNNSSPTPSLVPRQVSF